MRICTICTADAAIILSANASKVVTASAGSPAIAQLLSTAAAGLAGQAPSSIVTDVVQLPAGDPRGVGIASAAFPIIIAGLGAGAMAGLRFRRSGARVALIGTAAGTSGLLFTGILNWLGVLNGRYWPVAAAITLAAGARRYLSPA